MQGHVPKRGTTFSTVIDLPPGPDGMRRQKWTAGFATRKWTSGFAPQPATQLQLVTPGDFGRNCSFSY